MINTMPTDTLTLTKGATVKRYRMSKGRDRKVFRSTSKPHPSNIPTARFVMRGGIRK